MGGGGGKQPEREQEAAGAALAFPTLILVDSALDQHRGMPLPRAGWQQLQPLAQET